MNAFLIDIATIKEHGYTHGNVGVELIAPTLRRVQDIELKAIIGSSLFNRLLDGVNNDNLNADETELLNTYIKDFLVSACDHKIVNHLIFQLRNSTAGSSKDSFAVPLSSAERTTLLDDLRNDKESYSQALANHLLEKRDLFPEYKEYSGGFDFVAPETNVKVSPISFGGGSRRPYNRYA